MRDDLESALRQAQEGRLGAPKVADVEADLYGPPLPPELVHVWEWFLELHRARGGTGFGPAAIAWSELDAWAALTRRSPTPFECRLIMQTDNEFRVAWSKAQQQKK